MNSVANETDRAVILVGGAELHFSQHSPRGRLAPIVKTIWRARGTQAEFSAPEPIVPDGCVEIIFNLGDSFVSAETGERQPRVLLAGQMTRPVTALPTGDVDLLGVRFLTGRGGVAFRTPMHELQDSLLDASAVVAQIDRVADDLRNMPDDQRLSSLESQLPHLGVSEDRPINAIDHALALIESHRGNITIDGVARRVGITRRHLERRFTEEVGLSAKQFARIRRVHAALRLLDRYPVLGGAEIAARCGYSDQAHLIRECKALAGRTPARLMSADRSLAGLMREGDATRSA